MQARFAGQHARLCLLVPWLAPLILPAGNGQPRLEVALLGPNSAANRGVNEGKTADCSMNRKRSGDHSRQEGRSSMHARDVMTTDVITVGPETTIGEIAALLLDRRISAVPVIENGDIVGIVSEGDLMRRPETDTDPGSSPWLSWLTGPGVAPDRFSKAHGTTAREVMTRNVITVTPDTPLDQVAHLLESKRIKRVPVVENGRLW